jgi:hypothetical protein
LDKVERNRAAVKRHYSANKEYYLEKNRRKRLEIANYIRELKEQSSCLDCCVNYPHYILEFDHTRGTKKIHISKATSWKMLHEELLKCDIVCANCHSARTWQRQQL